MLLSIADKNSQATEIIVNLKSNPNLRGKLESEADILAGVRKILEPQDVEMRINRVRVIE